jgi:hypothetical protein
LAVLTQLPSQRVAPPVHPKPQVPALQMGSAFSGAAQTTLQAPQCATLVSRSTHSLPQGAPPAQATVQSPSAQTWPASQLLPQAPQLAKLELVSTQAPLQLM